MKARRLLLLTSLCCSLSFSLFSQSVIGRQQVDQYPCTWWGTMAYGLTWLPNDYTTNLTQKYPLIIFLHGLGETGDGVSGLNNLLNTGLPMTIAQGWDPEAINPVDGQSYKFIVVSPQATTATAWSHQWNSIQYILPDVINRYRVDTSRIYVTGLSAGGNGTWTCLTSGPQAAKKFAAAVPIASAPVPLDSIPQAGALYGVKLWQVCGDQDAFYNFATASTASYNGGTPAPNPQAVLTVFNGQGHTPAVWNTAYNPSWTSNAHNKNIYQWMLQYKRAYSSTPLTVHAGADQVITLPVNTAGLSGNAVAATGDTILSTHWTKVSGPAGDSILDASSDTTAVTSLSQGVYAYRFTATSSSGETAADTVQITVNAPQNSAPVVFAGMDTSVTLPNDSLMIAAAATDADGSIVSWNWTKIAGPSSFVIVSSTQASTWIKNLVQGSYQFEVMVTDNGGAVARDTISITVNNQPAPTCNGIRRYMIPNSGDHGKQISGDSTSWWYQPVNPGDTIVLKSQHSWTYFRMENYHGTASCPIVVINEGGQVWMRDGIDATNVHHLKITGSGASNTYYGFKIYNPVFDGYSVAIGISGKSKNVEVERIDVLHKGYGVWAKQDPLCDQSFNYPNYVMENIEIHHSRFKRIWQDCIYAGNTDPLGDRPVYCNGVETHPIPMRMSNVNIHHLIIDSCGRTGIQLSGADGGINRIHDNIVTNCGYEYNQWQGTGISIGGMTRNCYVYNNVVKNTFLYGIFDLGADSSFIYNNVVDSSGFLPIDPSVDINSIAASTNTTALPGHWLKNTMSLPGNIQATTRNSIPHYTKTVFYKNNRLGTNASTIAPQGIIQFGWWGPAQDWTTNNKVCNNTRLDGVTPAKIDPFWYTNINQYWPVFDSTCSVPGPNVPPAAHAGADTVLATTATGVLLQGAGTDPDGTITAYNWSQVGGPSCVIVQADSAHTMVNAMVAGVYTFRLKVTDNSGASATDDVQVFLNAPNDPPITNAGPYKVITLPVNSLTLQGSAVDPNGDTLTYAWSKISGPAAHNFAAASQPSTLVSNLVPGIYMFELAVTDQHGAIDRDTTRVDVNIAPTANAGPDQTITLPVNSVSVQGTAADTDGTLSSFTWKKISGPAQFTITSPNSMQTTITGLVQGVYYFEFRVTDNFDAPAKDTMMVTVLPSPNTAPVANAGADITIQLPVNQATLAGSGTDADGTITNYNWSMISGPAPASIASPAQAQTSIGNLVQGTYYFQLQVTDNGGASGYDTVMVTVLPAPSTPNMPPVVNAGNDVTIQLPVNQATLTGSAQDSDGSIVSWQWTKLAGPSSFIITSSTQPQTTVDGLVQGVYQFELMVTDDDGATAKDTVQVTVLPAVNSSNLAPVAFAGFDQQIIFPTSSVVLNGSGTDADGTIAAYEWKKISGPVVYNIVSPNTAQTQVNGLLQGSVYSFELTVTDNLGATGKDTVSITVSHASSNMSPVAHAGADKTITLPEDSVAHTGTGYDPDGSVVSYKWTRISGPLQYTIASPNSASTVFRNLEEGEYLFELRVTDNWGAVGRDTIKVTVVNQARFFTNSLLYPNPARNELNVRIVAQTEKSLTVIRLYDLRGALVKQESFLRTERIMERKLQIADLKPGSYVVVVSVDIDTQLGLKFIKQ